MQIVVKSVVGVGMCGLVAGVLKRSCREGWLVVHVYYLRVSTRDTTSVLRWVSPFLSQDPSTPSTFYFNSRFYKPLYLHSKKKNEGYKCRKKFSPKNSRRFQLCKRQTKKKILTRNRQPDTPQKNTQGKRKRYKGKRRKSS